ncbi:MAG: anaerobic glycerol-3-phosphate dehydrogenase subunit GlpA [Chloroflexota bacterium]|nr:anaerobic glycerol-3-phosphate dehydrogenase subunit GlpA [Chloroflexota bacterium]
MQTDVLIIGGGATGGGIALDLALRGVRVLLAEMGDLATGTSGRYHGLLHSGGRYAVRDAESARECIDENRILRRIAPQSVEDTGGYFVLCPGDDVAYVDTWLTACASVGITTRAVPLGEALQRERTLNPRLEAIYEVEDGTCDSWDLLHGIEAGARAAGATFLTYHKVEQFHLRAGRLIGARLRHLRTDETIDVECAVAINAAGPWAAEVGKLAGVSFGMKLSRGAMLAYNLRWVNTVINKLRLPGDGDIFVPVGTVSVIGTTSVKTTDPGDVRVEAWEVERILDEAEAMTPGISRARILRAWGGVRPLYDGGAGGDQRDAKRTFTTLDHEHEGAAGFVSIVGGKLTTYRLMAEKISDLVCAKLGVAARSTTATTPLPAVHGGHSTLHRLRGRLEKLEHGATPGALICECELVTEPQIADALAHGDVNTLHDLRRDLRLGMGPCQGGFCSYRAAAVRHEIARDTPAHTRALLAEFVERRVGGMKALLWGHNLRQALLAEQIYGRMVGLGEQTSGSPLRAADIGRSSGSPLPTTTGARMVIVGAGLAGWMAALTALDAGAKVELVAAGQGALTLHPGWIEVGDVEALSANPEHPYATARGGLAHGLARLHAVTPLTPAAYGLMSMGTRRAVDYAAGGTLMDIPAGAKVAVIGVAGWRDFFAALAADTLCQAGVDAFGFEVTLPHFEGNFDDWAFDFARWLDTDDGVRALIDKVKPRLNGATLAAFPAILGFKTQTRARLAAALGIPIIEIATLTPSIPGLRLYEVLRRAVLARGGRVTIGARVVGLETRGGRVTGIAAATAAHDRARIIPADAVILATGGLYGGGLESDYHGRIVEPVANLPVVNVPPRVEWMDKPILTGERQPIHAVGLAVDAALRPLNADGDAAYPNLYAAGRLLAGYSPLVEGCTEGVDIASGAWAAVNAAKRN